ncbi:hypothetical protein RHS01_02929 [Rhizoctonia solani]|uniref:Uncharacterized protein n=1 Tax=Rhizoctonia solani TaxID=456999 RepID=A0A8H7IFT1_9AGAM|nr:hypothetical protein RHS01_02929 [Rhizoctonia solani]
MTSVYQHGTTSALDSKPSLSARQQVHPIQQPHAPRSAVTTPHVLGANPYHTGTRPIPLRRETHVKSLTGQPLRGRWELDTSESPLAHAAAHPSKTLKVLCKNDADLQLECQGKALLEARIQITGRGWLHPQIEAITEYGDGVIEMVTSIYHIKTPQWSTYDDGRTKWYCGGVFNGLPSAEEGADGRHSRFLDLIHVSPGGGSVRVLVGDEGLLRASGLVAGVLVAKQRAEDELARRRSRRT